MTQFIDTHAHLYDERLMKDDHQIPRAITAGVQRMMLPNCDKNTISGMLQLADQYPDNCYPMMGLHPTYVKEDYKDELMIVAEWLGKRKFYAVGEVGLDYYWDLTFKAEQKQAFMYQIDLALAYHLPVIIHSRESNADSIDIIADKQNGALTGIFHCFSGTLADAQRIIDLGFLLGIGGVVTYPKSNLPEILASVPLTSIVLETDAPYLSPIPFRGKRNESSYIPYIAARIGEIKGIPIEEVARQTTINAEKVFKLSK